MRFLPLEAIKFFTNALSLFFTITFLSLSSLYQIGEKFFYTLLNKLIPFLSLEHSKGINIFIITFFPFKFHSSYLRWIRRWSKESKSPPRPNLQLWRENQCWDRRTFLPSLYSAYFNNGAKENLLRPDRHLAGETLVYLCGMSIASLVCFNAFWLQIHQLCFL